MQFFDVSSKKRKTDLPDENGASGGSATTSETFKKPRLSQNLSSSLSKTEKEKICLQRKDLPIFNARDRFLSEVKNSDSVILVGETGSGKTTQIPQFLFEAKLNLAKNLMPNKTDDSSNLGGTCCIAITQPRRVGAISLAKRVGEEMVASASVKIGPELPLDDTVVGYKVRFEDSTTDKTRIIFQTDGMLLREAMLDPLLSRYSWIILDEAHERTVNTDILFGIVKNAQRRRAINLKNRSQNKNSINNQGLKTRFFCEAPLKIIVMSATLDAQKFSAYFRNAPILLVLGRQHPVNVRHVSQSQDDWQASILTTIFQIHRDAQPQEDILVFLTGQEEIETMTQQIRQICQHEDALSHSFRPGTKLIPLPFYASLQNVGQQKVFTPSKEGTRKVILSTNVAETSITIPGIRYVIDSCRVRAKVHRGYIGLDIFQVVKISQAQGLQRTGRGGREGEGHCYRMLTKSEFEQLPADTIPEIQRSNLCGVLLQMLSIGIKKLSTFDFLEPPPEDAVQSALRQLTLLGAIQTETASKSDVSSPAVAGGVKIEDKLVLTPMGKKMSAFPLDPKLTKAIICAQELGCTEEVITIVSLLYGGDRSILLTPQSKREEALASRKKFISSEGDLITLLNIFRAYKQAKNQHEFCSTHFVHQRHLQFAMEVRKQLMQLCSTHCIPVQSCANHTDLVRKALALGMFTNVARLTREGNYVTLDSSQEVKIHPSSVMFGFKPELVIFCTLMSTQKRYIKDLSLADPAWLMDAQPEYFRKHRIIVGEND